MSRGTWTKLRQSNRFYVDTYRRATIALIFSMVLSVVLCVAIYFSYFGRSEHDFYATDGITPPIPLNALDEPNYTSVPLLANDQNQNDDTRSVPN